MHVNIYEELQDENKHKKKVLIVMHMEKALIDCVTVISRAIYVIKVESWKTNEWKRGSSLEKLYQLRSYPHISHEKTTPNLHLNLYFFLTFHVAFTQ